MAGGRQERTDDPADRGGLHPQGRNAMEDPGFARVAARRGGITGQRRPPPRSRLARQRHRACAMPESGAKLRRVSRSSSEWTETPQSESATRKRRRARSRRRRETPEHARLEDRRCGRTRLCAPARLAPTTNRASSRRCRKFQFCSRGARLTHRARRRGRSGIGEIAVDLSAERLQRLCFGLQNGFVSARHDRQAWIER